MIFPPIKINMVTRLQGGFNQTYTLEFGQNKPPVSHLRVSVLWVLGKRTSNAHTASVLKMIRIANQTKMQVANVSKGGVAG